MAGIQLNSVKKVYPNGFNALHGIDLDIKDGEFMVFVGPSGCAKSTLLRMIAGLESVSEGQILIHDRCVNDTMPKDRGIAMVFQNYALYPHMTVYKNMAFGLIGKESKAEIDRRVRDAAEKLEITNLLQRKPGQLSGGQCQRVAVGRAIVRKPKVFLFDEPLSNLDAKLRVSMRVQLIELHNQLKQEGAAATMVYVTHDQVEAMTMGDRICVMNRGAIMQVDKPINLYHQPANRFVAEFIGSPSMNLHDMAMTRSAQGIGLRIGDEHPLELPATLQGQLENYPHPLVCLGIRPESLRLCAPGSSNCFPAKIVTIERMGNEELLHCELVGLRFVLRMASQPDWEPRLGEQIHLAFDLSRAHLFDQISGQNLK
ncbi:sn-glycerol-3-phosphate import ATP-binding protein UgpC [Serratia quinivorans]|uniref:ABC transporter ATP-binding protein n=1 Tax=Serratia quinivorans TaxID=137545 RepID=UPI0021794BF8|nr:sn-glycerol-3-phosphate ABC transporter ATP-binding protein UgpC [Serratia quinivorans]CAI1568085.1 sn-glycerol-3-phosphate import ATP-binding protein UgpC [Serratia quinivorans]CAI1669184.1 sn-glycerol-3-phosphate import ATP-binding protein UgpC [Serratia quinivorans]CAI2039853.1 sn-glycerol-3-phosphate import ATP-binding protein UgpC [Serratia quinivorans]CAI2133728.1 sn-glycerol-3-phosphate import ATP-binding protein UgpC [Serratia quinivorans]CAI2394917.1 sn-glycerol-3-phosphate import 